MSGNKLHNLTIFFRQSQNEKILDILTTFKMLTSAKISFFAVQCLVITVFARESLLITKTTLSHELKTSLNSIIGNLDLLEDGIDKCNIIYYKSALSSSHILSNRINDLFDFIQIQDREFVMHIKSIKIEILVNELVEISKWPAEMKNLKFSSIIESNVPTNINCDPIRIKQVLLNLLMKAIEYTDYGKIIFRVELNKENLTTFKIISVGTPLFFFLLRFFSF